MNRRTFLSMLAGSAVASTISPVLAQSVLKVGSTPTGMPFTFLDPKTNTIEGVMVDLVKAIGAASDFKVEIEGMQFSTLVPALTSKKIDLISAAMYITPVRLEVINFSDPIYTYGEGLLVPATDTKDYVSFNDMKGYVVGAQIGTAYVDALKATGLFPEVKLYKTSPDLLADVNAGRVQAVFADAPIMAYTLKQGQFPNVRLVKSYKPTITGSVGIGVRKGEDELLKRVNAGLAKVKADGTLAKILAKWGLE